MNKRHVLKLLGVGAMLGVLSGCGDFGSTNVNPVQPTSLNPIFLFTNAQLNMPYGASTFQYEAAIVQQAVTPYGGVLAGGNFNQDNRGNTQGNWYQYYDNVVKPMVDVINTTKSDPNRTNLYNMARILKAWAFQILTDTYGDIPYSQAGLGYLQSNYFPKYDAQQDIYTDLLKEFEQATAALDASKPTESGDLFYGGDITKYKRLGYSLLLRAGMRLTKVNPTLAQQTVQKAVAGGVFQSNADNAVIYNNGTYNNPLGSYMNSSEKANYYLAQTFVDYLKRTGDPRLGAIAVTYDDPTKNVGSTGENRDPSKQVGLPIGYSDATLSTAPGYKDLGSIYKYAQSNRSTVVSITAPMHLITYAQIALLQAEAAQRGWIQADPAALYNAGVTAHMQQMATYGSASAISDASIKTYLAANAYDPARALELINTQYWVACYLNFPEAWANVRRSGYPSFLVPNNFASQDVNPKGSLIRRLTYPLNEISVNSANVQDAISRTASGSSLDRLDTRVWWDKQ